MASRGGLTARVNGSRDKICHFKLVLLGKTASLSLSCTNGPLLQCVCTLNVHT